MPYIEDIIMPPAMASARDQWDIRASSLLSKNPIRATLAAVTGTPPDSDQPVINLALGDPTSSNLYPPPPSTISAITRVVQTSSSNGYLHGSGSLEARQAVCEYHAKWDKVDYSPSAVILTHGASHALDMIFNVVVPPSTSTYRPNLLIPRPGFALYRTQLQSLGVEIREYECLPDRDWEINLIDLARCCDENTVGILVTNPSNPCGSNFSRSHLQDIIHVAERAKVPIIADEIYAHMTWDSDFVPMARLSSSVPIFTLSGLSKRFLLPGWRFGWVVVHDPAGLATAVTDGLHMLANRILGPNSLVQAALPEILETPGDWFEGLTSILARNAKITHEGINGIYGLVASAPRGAMYLLIGISSAFNLDDIEFSRLLYKEQALFVLPGSCFGAAGYFRISLASTADALDEAVRRIGVFSSIHCLPA
ncbi:pyridoxal phosphate-dependent transferase [Kockovaella imperatae]|uniref:Pyridoxal phosphate-dependent transferase n=1 Tax=Kockovaella imperatae TaxID=4999 RepID=A0A1Y1UEM9_9TREE|nr:pyridoxal phosphate-dependent transferase [Kockovaella imperatae]ORX35525.1 pyridoxal phosphate-dependent transferase [Kockovaella imperatae]